jgi:membrane-associated phospholipid phosphatase
VIAPDTPRFDRPGLLLGVASVMLASSAAVAAHRPIPVWEADLTVALNNAPDLVARISWPVMQSGSFFAPLVIGATAAALGRRRLAVSVVVSGLVAWIGAKGIKELSERERPLAYLPDIVVREGDGSGLGFVSGHSAVAAACATCLIAALPLRWRPVAGAAAICTGLARIVHGVHFPADVVGGWSLGVILGVTATWSSGRVPIAS